MRLRRPGRLRHEDDVSAAGLVYLDTNAASNLFRPGAADDVRVRAAELLLDDARGGRSPIVFSVAILDELAAVAKHDRGLFDRITGFLWLGETHLLRSTYDLAHLEVAARRRLVDRERFESRDIRRDVRRWYGQSAFLAERAADVRRQTEEFKREEEARRADVRRQVAASPQIRRSIAVESRDWWTTAEQRIDEWVRESWAADAKDYGLPPDAESWPQPSSIPTVWGMFAFKMARMHLNIGENRRVDGSDFHDAHHYVAASYAEVLVTDDARFRQTCELIPTTRFQVIGLEEFVRGVVSSPTSPTFMSRSPNRTP